MTIYRSDEGHENAKKFSLSFACGVKAEKGANTGRV